MSVGPLVTEIVVAFFLTSTLLYRYGNILRNHIIVTISVLIAWYFSLLIIFVLPLDVSSTVYRQCIELNLTVKCEVPWSNVPENVFPNLWKIVYWASQCLTWLILPLMQSYIKAGDFTVRGKLKSALIDNAIYYGSYLFICGVLLIYIAFKPGLNLDDQKIKAIASSASNTWGLFLLVLLLGYALVEVPRGLWNASKPGFTLQHCYFKASKLSIEKCEAEETVDDILESLHAASLTIRNGHPFHQNLETIFQKVPIELRERMNRRQLPDDTHTDVPSEKSLIRLHRQTIKALQTLQRTETQWTLLIEKIFRLEDIAKNQLNSDTRFKSSYPSIRPIFLRVIYNPTVEWYWQCVIKNYVRKMLAIIAGCLSVAVVWSEVTFFNKEPVLSLFAQFLNLAKKDHDYLTIEVIEIYLIHQFPGAIRNVDYMFYYVLLCFFLMQILSTVIIAYLCYCAYSTVLKIRLLNLYYLAPHHQTDEYSLIFSGMMLCRLTPPMCLNFLGLIHMDSHIIKTHILETHYTQVMGHMDVISIISDGFNVYFPMAILAFCLTTYFSVGSRLLSVLGFQQFLGDDELTADLVDEGKELIQRERRRRQRAEESINRRREFQERFNNPSASASRYRTPRQNVDNVRPLRRDDSTESARAGLLRDSDSADYYAGTEFNTANSYGAGNAYERRDYERNNLFDSNIDDLRNYSATLSSSNKSPPQRLFDDV